MVVMGTPRWMSKVAQVAQAVAVVLPCALGDGSIVDGLFHPFTELYLRCLCLCVTFCHDLCVLPRLHVSDSSVPVVVAYLYLYESVLSCQPLFGIVYDVFNRILHNRFLC